MKVSDITRRALHMRRFDREMKAAGYEQITCKFGIGNLWELDRGCRTEAHIVDAKVGADGKSVWVKVERCE